MHPSFPNPAEIQPLLSLALMEDIGGGDITSELLLPEKLQCKMVLRAREDLVVAGMPLLPMIFDKEKQPVAVQMEKKDGDVVGAGEILAIIAGDGYFILSRERIALNFLQRLSGVATLVAAYVEQVENTKAVILDTRKTIPGWRVLDKYAVRCGGGQNHRMRLDDTIFIKDNHIALCGSIEGAVAIAREHSRLPIVVECDTLEQVEECLRAKPDRILLDNMSLNQLREAVKRVKGLVPLEASGNVNLGNVVFVAETGVDFISIGRLTHSAKAVDIGADMIVQEG